MLVSHSFELFYTTSHRPCLPLSAYTPLANISIALASSSSRLLCKTLPHLTPIHPTGGCSRRIQKCRQPKEELKINTYSRKTTLRQAMNRDAPPHLCAGSGHKVMYALTEWKSQCLQADGFGPAKRDKRWRRGAQVGGAWRRYDRMRIRRFKHILL
jgi:hypothetical protein